MLSSYLNQTLSRKTISSRDDNNDITYSASSDLKCRFIFKRELFRLPNGEETMSDAIIYSETAINEGDVVTRNSVDWTIRNIYPWVKLDGTVLGYKGMI